ADNPALTLAAALAGAGQSPPQRDKLLLAPLDSPHPGFADWIEQLVAESTGKQQTGLLPVVAASAEAPELALGLPDVLTVYLTGLQTGTPDGGPAVQVSGSLGGQFLLWEVATAAVGRLLGVNPFDQPDVERAKVAARAALAAPAGLGSAPALVDRDVEITGAPELLGSANDLPSAVSALLDCLGERDYLAVMAYLDRREQGELSRLRDALAARTGRPVTFGWGPRFLHSTGQYHKGGPATGVFVQITGAPRVDAPIAGQDFSFGQLIAAQAAGDAQVLSAAGRPLLRLHLTDRTTGLAHLLEELT
ncbi:MAG: glucose-6-phosphate isomerase, partial [Angustibacter sp.]